MSSLPKPRYVPAGYDPTLHERQIPRSSCSGCLMLIGILIAGVATLVIWGNVIAASATRATQIPTQATLPNVTATITSTSTDAPPPAIQLMQRAGLITATRFPTLTPTNTVTDTPVPTMTRTPRPTRTRRPPRPAPTDDPNWRPTEIGGPRTKPPPTATAGSVEIVVTFVIVPTLPTATATDIAPEVTPTVQIMPTLEIGSTQEATP